MATRAERLADLIAAEQDRWYDETQTPLWAADLPVYFGMSPGEYFAEELDDQEAQEG
jgi:hypothetical protein